MLLLGQLNLKLTLNNVMDWTDWGRKMKERRLKNGLTRWERKEHEERYTKREMGFAVKK